MEAQAHQQQQWMHHGHPSASTFSAMASSQPYTQPTSVEEVRTLWIGDLQYWVDENYLHSCFAHTGEVYSLSLCLYLIFYFFFLSFFFDFVVWCMSLDMNVVDMIIFSVFFSHMNVVDMIIFSVFFFS